MAKHYQAEQWAAWVGEQRDSELSVAEFCEWIGVSLNSFYRWRQKLTAPGSPLTQEHQEPPADTHKLSSRQRTASSEPRFVPLTVLTSPVVEIDLPCGAVVRVPNDDRSLRRVLGILLEADQRTEESAIATPRDERREGGRR